MIPVASLGKPKWMCEKRIGAFRLLKVSWYISVVPSELRVAANEPVPSVATGGTSLRPRSRAWNALTASSFAARARQNAGTRRATKRNFFMSISLLNFGRILERFAAEVNLVGIPDLALILGNPTPKVRWCQIKIPLRREEERSKRYEGIGIRWEFVAKGTSRG
jgi:hypothetical protein